MSTFIGSSLKEDGITFVLKDYLELADWTGRVVRDDKRGSIDAGTPGLLQKLQLDEDTWMETVQGFSKGFQFFCWSRRTIEITVSETKKALDSRDQYLSKIV